MQVFIIVVVGWLISVCLHEFGHAITAYVGGDEGVRRRGHLTNPLTYIHPVNSIIMPMLYLAIGGIGLPGAAVMVDERRIRSRLMRVMMSLAGPIMSAVAGIILAFPFITGKFVATDTRPLVVAMGMLVQLQVTAVLLNLLPIPPLDGFQALASLLFSYETKRYLMSSSSAGAGIFILIMVYFRGVRRAIWQFAFTFTEPLGLNAQTFSHAWEEFKFWPSLF